MARAFLHSLTPDAIEYLNDTRNIFVRAGSHRGFIVITLAGILLAGVVASLTYDYRWSPVKFGLFSLLLFASAFLLTYGVKKWFSGRDRSIPAGLVVTPEHTVFVSDVDVEWFRLADLVNADYRHQFDGRKYEFSTLLINHVGGLRKFRVEGLEMVESIVDDIEARKRERLIQANRLENDWSATILDTLPITQRRYSLRSLVLLLVPTVALGIGGAFGAAALNEHFHDRLSWSKAVDMNSAASYRGYLRNNSKGRYRDDAAIRLKAFYDSAEVRYKESLKPGFDQAAVDSILALLRYARETQEYQIRISFERSADVPIDLVERLKEEYEVKTVLPIGNTFTEERVMEREGQLFGVLQIAFKQIFPDDVLELVRECSGDCSVLNIRYETSFLNSIYYDLKEKDIPREDRQWSPGILIEWTCSLKIPGQAEPYVFELESAPADDITYDTVETGGVDHNETDKQSFYDAMVASSFDDFRAHLLFNLGLGPDPHPEEDNAKT